MAPTPSGDWGVVVTVSLRLETPLARIPLGVLMNKGITIRTAQQPGQRYMPRMLEHVQAGELDPSILVTHRMTLEEAPRGYQLFKDKEDGCLRAVFAP